MSIPNLKININIDRFDDREQLIKLREYLEQHHGSNVSIKELINFELLSDANKQLLSQLKAFKQRQKSNRLYIHGYIIKRINTERGELIIILIRFKNLRTNRTFTIYPDILLPMIKFTIDDIDRCLNKHDFRKYHRFDFEALEQLVLRINDPLIYSHCSKTPSNFLQIIRNLFNEKVALIHKLFPQYSCTFHT